MKDYKFRIFVDGSFDNAYNIGTVAYHMQDAVYNVDGKLIKLGIANKTFASQVRGCRDSLDSEICAIALGFDILKKVMGSNPILNKVPVRIKSDNLPLVKYITKSSLTKGLEFNDDLIEELDYLRNKYVKLKEEYSNFKLSYIPSKKNLAHDNAIEMLRWERLQRIERIGNNGT